MDDSRSVMHMLLGFRTRLWHGGGRLRHDVALEQGPGPVEILIELSLLLLWPPWSKAATPRGSAGCSSCVTQRLRWMTAHVAEPVAGRGAWRCVHRERRPRLRC